MPVKMKKPARDVGRSFVPSGGVPLFVGGTDPSGVPWNWNSVARTIGMNVKDLLRFNYKTTNPEEINFYLERNCGCRTVSSDGHNYRFLHAAPGVIFVPIVPPVLFFRPTFIRPMELRPHPTAAGRFEMKSIFNVNVSLNRRLADPTLFEYRQFIRGGGFTEPGTYASGAWASTGSRVPIPPTTFPIPGSPPGLLPTFKEDGVVRTSGTLQYGHRGTPPFASGFERDEYVTPHDYVAGDQPGLEGNIVVGLRISLQMDFVGKVVRFDRPPGVPGRRIVEEVSKRTWSFSCDRKIRSASPLVVEP